MPVDNDRFQSNVPARWAVKYSKIKKIPKAFSEFIFTLPPSIRMGKTCVAPFEGAFVWAPGQLRNFLTTKNAKYTKGLLCNLPFRVFRAFRYLTKI